MKCLILAGGRGDRMWPLSRKNYPKQFIQIRNKHSIFQETVARNMAFCDEFIIAVSIDYQSIIENQMKAFEGLTYRCIYEGQGRNTTAPIVLSALSLASAEILFVVSSDHLISGESYKDDILKARELCKNGNLVTFGMEITRPDTRFGYIRPENGKIVEFTDKPDADTALNYQKSGNYYINSGMFMFRVGEFLNELKTLSPYVYSTCNSAYYMKEVRGNNTFYAESTLQGIPSQSIEKSIFESTKLGTMIASVFGWRDVGSLDDLTDVHFEMEGEEQLISNKCENTTVINRCNNKLVLVNHLEDIMVVNTEDAVYIGKKGQSNDLKEIIHDSQSMWGYFDRSRLFYRVWGESRIIDESPSEGYQVRKITVFPGRTITAHSHNERNESWVIVQGSAVAKVGDVEKTLNPGDNVFVPIGVVHQISCISECNLVFIETGSGMNINSEDFVSVASNAPSEAELGYDIEPFIKLSPAYKDYLWGGRRLIDIYGKKCDYDCIAESWELSAHPDGQSVVASGRHRGLTFGEYLVKIGADNLGWKYQADRAFPLMIKLIDASKDLSVQVHPGDDYALEHENEYGKSELWHIIDAKQDACIYVGFKKTVSKEEFMESLNDGTVLDLLNKVSVHAGEDYYIPAGTVHAIGAGVLICEVQQNSNSTYRLYDYDRVDKYGNKRRLDIDKALDVIDLKEYKGNAKCKYFDVKTIKCVKSKTINTNEESFYSLVVLKGGGSIIADREKMDITAGDCIFIPKRSSSVKLEGEMEVLTARI